MFDFIKKRLGLRRQVNQPTLVPLNEGYIYQGREYKTSESYVPNSDDLETAWKVFDGSSEVFMVIQTLVDDILGNGYEIVSEKKQIKKKVEEILRKNNFKEVIENALYDMFIYGAGYVEYHKVDLEEVLGESYYDIKALRGRKPVSGFAVFNIDAKTMNIIYDEYGRVKGYVQKINGKEIKFREDEVIMFSLIRPSGRVYPISPVRTVAKDILLLESGKEYMIRFFENDGTPEGVWVVDDENGVLNEDILRERAEALKKQLGELKKLKNKRQSIVVYGGVKYSPINKYDKDMEFKELINHTTKIIASAYGVPPIRLGITTGSISERAAEVMMEAYYRRIDNLQSKIENVLNRRIFQDYGVEIKFNRRYLIDEMREAQILAILLDRGVISVEEAREKIGMPAEIQGKTKEQYRPDTATQGNAGDVEDEGTNRKQRAKEKLKPEKVNKAGEVVVRNVNITI